MKINRRKINPIDLLLVALLITLIVYWKEAITIGIILLVATIIYKCIKIARICNEDDRNFSCDVVTLEDREHDANWEYEQYLKDKYVQKGIEAEEKIIKILERIFPSYNIIHDSYFRDDELVTTQIDIIAIDTSGIYVIESKAYSSIVAGKTNEKMWVQLFGGKKYRKFSNPIIQNKRHINAVKNNLKEFGVANEAFKSYIVWDNNCKLDVEIDEHCDAKILQQKELFYTILEDRKITENIIDEKQVEENSRRLTVHANVDVKLKMEHIIRRRNNVKYDIKGR